MRITRTNFETTTGFEETCGLKTVVCDDGIKLFTGNLLGLSCLQEIYWGEATNMRVKNSDFATSTVKELLKFLRVLDNNCFLDCSKSMKTAAIYMYICIHSKRLGVCRAACLGRVFSRYSNHFNMHSRQYTHQVRSSSDYDHRSLTVPILADQPGNYLRL